MRHRFASATSIFVLALTLTGCGWIRPRSDFERDPFVMSHLTKEEGVAWHERQEKDSRLASTSHKRDQVSADPSLPRAASNTTPHAGDFRWVIGRLQRSQNPRAPWQIVYGPTGTDRFGGALPLEKVPQLGLVREGDRVLIEGEIVEPANQEPRYRVRSVARID